MVSYRPPAQPRGKKVLSRHARLLYRVRRVWGTTSTASVIPAPSNKLKFTTKSPALRIASWNVRTMCPGLSSDLQAIDDARKTPIINKELAHLNINVACLQETRLPDSGSLRETDNTFFWKGPSQDEPRQHGVGFAVWNALLASVETPTGGSSRLLVLRMKTSMDDINILSAYAPTLPSTPEAEDQFYEALEEALSCIPKSKSIYFLRDFNTHVGSDWQVWPTCHHCHQLDLVITRRASLSTVLDMWSYHSADCKSADPCSTTRTSSSAI